MSSQVVTSSGYWSSRLGTSAYEIAISIRHSAALLAPLGS